jgi:hypothetical protein
VNCEIRQHFAYNVKPEPTGCHLLKAKIRWASLTFVLVANHALAEGIPCWIRCHNPPDIHSAHDVTAVLRNAANPPLNWLARSTGILTTYLGKMAGIQGWRDYHLCARVQGKVVQSAGSSDGLYTIDLAVEQMTVGTRFVEVVRPSFIRIEVFPRVRKGAPLPMRQGDQACISGELMWDADGFLEIHPHLSNEIAKSRCS